VCFKFPASDHVNHVAFPLSLLFSMHVTHTLAFTGLHMESHWIFAWKMYLRSTKHNNKHFKYFFPPHSLLVFFLPAFFLFYLCFMLFRLHCFLPSVVVYRSASVSFYYYSIYYSIVDQEHLKKNSLFALVAEILLYIGHRKGKSKNIDKIYQKQEGIICNI